MTDNTPMRGVFAPVLTPFRRDLSPDTGRFVSLCQWLLDQGCHGLVLFGTTSEANSLALEEREALTEAVIEAGIPAAKLMVGTGLCALPETVRLTRHAVELGCGGALMLPPFFYKGMSDAGLYRAFAEVIERVGDVRLAVYLYHFPKVSNVPLSLDLIERLITDYGETVVGIKDSSGDWQNTSAMIERFPGFGIYPGNEVLMLAALRGGSPGCITATANVGARLIRRLYDEWETADADDLQAQVTAIRQALQSAPLVPGLKRILARHMGDDGWLNLRPPLVGLDDGATGELFVALNDAGFDLKLD